jgi:hypothetical protein
MQSPDRPVFAAIPTAGAVFPPLREVTNAERAPDVGYVASMLVLLSFIARDMRVLRMTAILSNVAFMLYAILDHLPPILFLHASLLPVNVFRLTQLLNVPVGHPNSPQAGPRLVWRGGDGEASCKARR